MLKWSIQGKKKRKRKHQKKRNLLKVLGLPFCASLALFENQCRKKTFLLQNINLYWIFFYVLCYLAFVSYTRNHSIWLCFMATYIKPSPNGFIWPAGHDLCFLPSSIRLLLVSEHSQHKRKYLGPFPFPKGKLFAATHVRIVWKTAITDLS